MQDSAASGGTSATGAREIVRFLEDHGYGHVFGLPGSSMVSVLHELQGSSVEYVPTIHESVTIAAADGYARVKGSGVAMVYMAPGTANALANLYNAWWDESPILVLASQQESTLRSADGDGTTCEGNTVQMVAPYTRMAHELTRDMPVRPWLERARRASLGLPSGPAFLSVCEDVYERPAPVSDARISTRAPSLPADLSDVAEALAAAERPLIVVGGQLRRAGGSAIVEELSDRFEIPVVYEGGFHGRLGVGPGRARTAGLISSRGAIFERDADVVVLIGAHLMIEGKPRTTPWFPEASFVAQANADPRRLERTSTAHWVSVCDPAAFARGLLDAVAARPHDSGLLERRARRIVDLREQAMAAQSLPPGNPTAVARANYVKGGSYLRDALNQGWVVDESVMAGKSVIEAQTCEDGHRYVGASGASLGWAPGAAAGVALASGEPVTCVLGDGSLRFGMHGLWTIAALKLPITLVILDNGGYGSTRFFERDYVSRLGAEALPPSYYNMDLRQLGPSVATLIRGFDIPCHELSPDDDVDAALAAAWKSRRDGPNAVIIPMGYEGK